MVRGNSRILLLHAQREAELWVVNWPFKYLFVEQFSSNTFSEERFFPHSPLLCSINVQPKKLCSKKVCPPAARCAYSPQCSPDFDFTMSNGMAFFSNRAADNEWLSCTAIARSNEPHLEPPWQLLKRRGWGWKRRRDLQSNSNWFGKSTSPKSNSRSHNQIKWGKKWVRLSKNNIASAKNKFCFSHPNLNTQLARFPH